jgi:hypothetical protein
VIPFELSDSTMEEPTDVNYSVAALKANEYQVQINRILLAVIAGAVSGILRVEGILNGLIMYALWNIVGSLIMIFMAGGPSKARKCFPNGTWDILLSQNFSGVMTFILIWTIVYDVVHIF